MKINTIIAIGDEDASEPLGLVQTFILEPEKNKIKIRRIYLLDKDFKTINDYLIKGFGIRLIIKDEDLNIVKSQFYSNCTVKRYRLLTKLNYSYWCEEVTLKYEQAI